MTLDQRFVVDHENFVHPESWKLMVLSRKNAAASVKVVGFVELMVCWCQFLCLVRHAITVEFFRALC